MGVPYSEDCCDDVEIAAEVEWSNISNVPSYITTDWSVDQGDTNIDANNIPLLSYAPNTLASNGTPGLSNFNFNQTRKQKLDSIENGAQVNVQANWDNGGIHFLFKLIIFLLHKLKEKMDTHLQLWHTTNADLNSTKCINVTFAPSATSCVLARGSRLN